MIKKIDDNIWVKDSYFKVLGCKGSTRMTLVKTAKGLLLHSPVDLNHANIAAIKLIGDVTDIVAPNLFHHMYFAACAEIYPQATCWAAKGLAQKIKGLPDHEILNHQQPIFNADELSQIEMGGHRLNETVFFHHPSATLITADFLYNYQAEQYRAEKIFFWLLKCYGKAAIPFYHYMSIFNKAAFSDSL